jgi:hypothetical protein
MSSKFVWLAVAFCCSFEPAFDASAFAADAAPARISEKPAVDQSFASSVAPQWRIAKGSWKIVDGAWQGAEIPADMHGAVARYPLAFTDGVLEFDFRLDGAKGISLSINDAKGHVCRLSIRPTGFQVTKDDHDHGGPDRRVVLADEQRPLQSGAWYHARVELAGPKMTAQIGDAAEPGRKVGGEHAMLGVTKANFGFTVSGSSASFKNLKVSLPTDQ